MKATFALAVIVVAVLFTHTSDFNDKAAAAEERAAKPRGQATASPEEARIWSQRCIRQGKQVLASQADGGKWKLSCVNAWVKA